MSFPGVRLMSSWCVDSSWRHDDTVRSQILAMRQPGCHRLRSHVKRSSARKRGDPSDYSMVNAREMNVPSRVSQAKVYSGLPVHWPLAGGPTDPVRNRSGPVSHPKELQPSRRSRRGDSAVDVPECRQLRLRCLPSPRTRSSACRAGRLSRRYWTGVCDRRRRLVPQKVATEKCRDRPLVSGGGGGGVVGPGGSGTAASGGVTRTRCHDAVPSRPVRPSCPRRSADTSLRRSGPAS